MNRCSTDSDRITITPKGIAFLKYFENIRDGISQQINLDFEDVLPRAIFSIDGAAHIYRNKNGAYEAIKICDGKRLKDDQIIILSDG